MPKVKESNYQISDNVEHSTWGGPQIAYFHSSGSFQGLRNQTGAFKCSKCPVSCLICTDLKNLFPALHIYIKRHQTKLVDFRLEFDEFGSNPWFLEFFGQRVSEDLF